MVYFQFLAYIANLRGRTLKSERVFLVLMWERNASGGETLLTPRHVIPEATTGYETAYNFICFWSLDSFVV